MGIGIDDSATLCKLLNRLFETWGADMTRSGSIGRTEKEQCGFVDVALGKLDVSLKPVEPERQRAADVLLMDQNILLNNQPHVTCVPSVKQLGIQSWLS